MEERSGVFRRHCGCGEVGEVAFTDQGRVIAVKCQRHADEIFETLARASKEVARRALETRTDG